MKKLTVCRSAIATTEESESETFAVRRVKTRPSVTSSRTIESRPFKSTSRLARNGGRSRPAADYGDANSRNPPLRRDRAADALEKASSQSGAAREIRHIDVLNYTNKVFRHLYSKAYLDMVNRMPEDGLALRSP